MRTVGDEKGLRQWAGPKVETAHIQAVIIARPPSSHLIGLSAGRQGQHTLQSQNSWVLMQYTVCRCKVGGTRGYQTSQLTNGNTSVLTSGQWCAYHDVLNAPCG